MNILEITSKGYENGGVETGIVNLSKILKERGHVVKILTSNFKPELKHFSDFEFDAIEYKSFFGKLFYRCFYPESYFALKDILKNYKPDIVQIHTINQISPSILFLLKNYPVVLTVHQGEDYIKDLLVWSFPQDFFKDGSHRKNKLTIKGKLHYFYHYYINSKIFHLGFRNVDKFIVASDFMQMELNKEKINSIKIPNGIKIFNYYPIEPENKFNIAYVGRLEEVKGPQFIIKALPKILKKYSSTQLIIAGAGNYERDLKILVDSLGLTKNVIFLGHVKHEEILEVYKKSSVIIFPSIVPEGFGNVGVEAMSMGRPVIASKVGAIPEWLIDGKTGYLIEPGDFSAISNRVIDILSNEELLTNMSLNSSKQAQNFSLEIQAEKTLDLFQQVVDDYKKRGHVCNWKNI